MAYCTGKSISRLKYKETKCRLNYLLIINNMTPTTQLEYILFFFSVHHLFRFVPKYNLQRSLLCV